MSEERFKIEFQPSGEVRLCVYAEAYDAQRLRADTAEAELATMTEFRDNAAKKIFRMRAKITAAEQRIANHESTLRHFANCADARQVGTSAMDYVAALNQKSEVESHG